MGIGATQYGITLARDGVLHNETYGWPNCPRFACHRQDRHYTWIEVELTPDSLPPEGTF